MKISLVICTHNRAGLLDDAIQSVLVQDYPKELYELIVVDNASTDHTHQTVEEFMRKYPNVRYIFESKIGLSHARNRGWEEARGEYVGYLDDDAEASHNWLSAARDVAESVHPEAFGGPYYAFYNTPKPRWFKDEYGSNVQGHVARPLNDNEYVSGGNMFIRRDILMQLGGFHANLGMKGKKKGYGEETNFLIRMRATVRNAVIYYDPKVFIYHLVGPEKFKPLNIISAHFVRGSQYYNLLGDDNSSRALPALRAILIQILNITKSLTWDILWRDRQAYPFCYNYFYERTAIFIFGFGYQVKRLRASKKFF